MEIEQERDKIGYFYLFVWFTLFVTVYQNDIEVHHYQYFTVRSNI